MTTVASDLERYMLDLINADRAALGLAPLVLELNLNTSAQAHSDWMVAADVFSHTGAGGSSATQRMLAAGMDLSGSWRSAENIAAVSVSGSDSYYDEVAQLHANLMNSPGHYANLMDPDLVVVGIGIALGPLTYEGSGTWPSVLVTQNFAATGGFVDLDLSGGSGNEMLAGQGGDDHIAGGAGDDTLSGGGGNDTLEGGAGTDTVLVDQARGAVTVGGTAAAPVLSAPGMVLTLSGVERVRFADGEVALGALYGGAGGGTPGNDLLQGAEGAVTLSGLGGDDVILGEGRGLYGTDVSAQVYRLYAAVFGREPDVNGHQAWVARLATGARTPEEVVTGFMASPEFQATYGNTTDAEFVTLLYTNVLTRAPDEAGLASWLASLDGGMSRERLVLLFAESPEHQLRSAAAQEAFDIARDPTDQVDDVYRLYRGIFDREPDAGGLTGWVAALAGGQPYPAVVAQFMASPEFQSTYGATTDAEFITLLYRNVLDRAPDPGGFAAWSSQLAGGMSRETLVERFVNSPEFVAGTAPDLAAYMAGFGPDDVLRPGAGDDMLSGGMWADTFVFDPAGPGAKTVSDLEPWDVIDLTGFGYADVAEAMTHVTTVESDAVFEDAGLRVVFLGAEVDAGMVLV
ncbi:DUF4214 domain-containing protein [Mameliella sp. LZ-28]|uniref:DUF4214 domain-containing protein n=1 Tax=Mameliella sp. LZ-28 TaxID=2484146 RepID=UPI00143F83A9|nr:DUF4214 domain-containing protein [Mameliella sp. LZ-28]